MQAVAVKTNTKFCRKAKTARGARFLENREPKVVENTKQAMFIKGTTTSQVVSDAMADLVSSQVFLVLIFKPFLVRT